MSFVENKICIFCGERVTKEVVNYNCPFCGYLTNDQVVDLKI